MSSHICVILGLGLAHSIISCLLKNLLTQKNDDELSILKRIPTPTHRQHTEICIGGACRFVWTQRLAMSFPYMNLFFSSYFSTHTRTHARTHSHINIYYTFILTVISVQ